LEQFSWEKPLYFYVEAFFFASSRRNVIFLLKKIKKLAKNVKKTELEGSKRCYNIVLKIEIR
jgi:hypothetical protein